MSAWVFPAKETAEQKAAAKKEGDSTARMSGRVRAESVKRHVRKDPFSREGSGRFCYRAGQQAQVRHLG